GEVHCEFVDVAAVGDSYEISAMCTAEAPPAPYEIDLAVAEGPREMLVSGGPWAEPVRLIYCGPHPDEQRPKPVSATPPHARNRCGGAMPDGFLPYAPGDPAR